MEISLRLERVGHLVKPCESMADIGTDHGYLPIALVQSGKVKKAFACDVRKGPLARASAHIQELGLEEKIKPVLSDGIESVPEPVDVVVMAGMGGALMAELIASEKGSAPVIRKGLNQLVLQPQSEPETVREQLDRFGFKIDAEDMVCDREKYYVIISAVPGADEKASDYYRFGNFLANDRNPVFREYLFKEKEKNIKLLSLLVSQTGESAKVRLSEVEEELKLIERELQKWSE